MADFTSTILQNGGELSNQADYSGSQPLHLAASVGVPGITSLLVAADNAGAIMRLRNSSGMCPIHIAASVGAMDAVRALVSAMENAAAADGSPPVLDANGGTFLHVAVENKKAEVVEFICSRSSRFVESILNLKNNEGNTALHWQ